ncbi:O-antigen ligase domain-containing protein [Rhodoplanes sp. TEM]|uniref:O-antigen ligase domain-containing protein n=1 Tax=Rhodoplanes tepidamans TaxID=200616 RepID=A0ABT5JIQ6_RHOTP|nr:MULTISPECIES: O-antigen ligase family protein [Rhodoplanes]MDC7789449.1 O-antigen ligase domain-containing protein [Rhodoplanes tepidamans]MDC7985414.1 O-antigen ligase domain-containing protein [Rhodoplanes sp. TEM]MDQ0353624.1 O-antigen ligase [Rhodoplanes tepidamans]
MSAADPSLTAPPGFAARPPAPAGAARAAGPAAPVAPAVARLQRRLLWLVGFSGGFVMIEPAPYELVVLLAMVTFGLTGLTLRPAHLPLVALMVLFNIGIAIGATQVIGEPGIAVWTFVSYFLGLTTLFVAAALADDPLRRFDALMSGWVLCAVVVSLIGILAYFGKMPSADSFLLYGRAKATFKDPNVFGPFLVLPALVALGRLTFGRLRSQIVAAAVLLILAGGFLLSFSRGAWGHFAFSAVLFLGLCYVTRPALGDRVRILVFAGLGVAAVALLVVALLSIPQVADLFAQRAALVQDYDAGHTGRFGRHVLGAMLMLENPFGIGPLQFAKYFPEDPHNSFLAAFASGGWLGGVTFVGLVLTTLAVGLRGVFIPSPVQGRLIAVYATFVGVVGESYIIDVLHWRHYFLLMGLVWGLTIAARSFAPGPAPAGAAGA